MIRSVLMAWMHKVLKIEWTWRWRDLSARYCRWRLNSSSIAIVFKSWFEDTRHYLILDWPALYAKENPWQRITVITRFSWRGGLSHLWSRRKTISWICRIMASGSCWLPNIAILWSSIIVVRHLATTKHSYHQWNPTPIFITWANWWIMIKA